MRPLLFALLALAAVSSCKTASQPASTPTPPPATEAVAAETAAATPAKTYDLSTPAKRAEAAKEAAGLKSVGACVQEVEELRGVVLVGYDGHNGCVDRGYFANDRYFAEREDARAALGAAWDDRATRESAARTWLAKGLDITLQTKEGAPTPATLSPDGAVVFEGYDPLPRHSAGFFHRMRVTVSRDGKVTSELLEKWLEPSQLR